MGSNGYSKLTSTYHRNSRTTCHFHDRQSPDRPENKTKKDKKKKRKKTRCTVVAVYPAPVFLLVFLRPFSPAEFWRIPWRGLKGGGNGVGAHRVVCGWRARSCLVGLFDGTVGTGVQVLYTKSDE